MKECEAGCGADAACEMCDRCDDRGCNGGCIYCRPKEEWDFLSRMIADHPVSSLLVIVAWVAYAAVMTAAK